jgi:hypothetical protein
MFFARTTTYASTHVRLFCRHDVFRNLKELNFAPSVAMQEVPRVSVAKEMKLPANDDEDDVYHSDEMSDLDQKLLSEFSCFLTGARSKKTLIAQTSRSSNGGVWRQFRKVVLGR